MPTFSSIDSAVTWQPMSVRFKTFVRLLTRPHWFSIKHFVFAQRFQWFVKHNFKKLDALQYWAHGARIYVIMMMMHTNWIRSWIIIQWTRSRVDYRLWFNHNFQHNHLRKRGLGNYFDSWASVTMTTHGYGLSPNTYIPAGGIQAATLHYFSISKNAFSQTILLNTWVWSEFEKKN